VVTACAGSNTLVVRPREPAQAMATRILVAIVRGGELEGDFADLGGVDLLKDVSAFKLHLQKEWAEDLAGITPRHMSVFRPWASPPKKAERTARLADDDAVLDPADILEPLLVGMARAYFLVRITTPPVAAGVSGVELARHAWSVPTILIGREIRHTVCPSCIPAHARQPLHHCTCTRVFLSISPCVILQARAARARRWLPTRAAQAVRDLVSYEYASCI
jgi:hypothetical protein